MEVKDKLTTVSYLGAKALKKVDKYFLRWAKAARCRGVTPQGITAVYNDWTEGRVDLLIGR